MSHFEFTGETKSTPTGVVLQRICATKPLPRFGVRVGDVGGWIESAANLSGGAWVSGDARVSGDAWVYGGAQVYDNANLSESQHVITVAPVGSESVTATAFHTEDGKHLLHVGCWTGTVDTLAAEVERRAKGWRCDEATAARWRAEYTALETLVRARITGWEASA